jgi:CubicO group peptidase (beta-lactamase class C family)
MTSSVTSTNPLRSADNVASPHAKLDGKLQPIPWRNIDNVGPAGSINSNVVEMAQWVRMQLKEGKYNDQQLISSGAVKEMHTPQMSMRLEPWLETPSPVNHAMVPGTHFMAYGLGWFLQDYRGRKVVHHGGSIDGMRAMVGMIPEEGLGVVVLTNLHGSSLMVALMFKVFDLYLGAPQRDWSAEMLAGVKKLEEKSQAAQKQTAEARAKETSPSLALEKYVGVYQNEMYGEAKVAVENNRLVLRLLGDTSELEHWHYDTFQALSKEPIRGKNFVTFVLEIQGKVDELKVHNLASFKRAPEPIKAVAGRSAK